MPLWYAIFLNLEAPSLQEFCWLVDYVTLKWNKYAVKTIKMILTGVQMVDRWTSTFTPAVMTSPIVFLTIFWSFVAKISYCFAVMCRNLLNVLCVVSLRLDSFFFLNLAGFAGWEMEWAEGKWNIPRASLI